MTPAAIDLGNYDFAVPPLVLVAAEPTIQKKAGIFPPAMRSPLNNRPVFDSALVEQCLGTSCFFLDFAVPAPRLLASSAARCERLIEARTAVRASCSHDRLGDNLGRRVAGPCESFRGPGAA